MATERFTKEQFERALPKDVFKPLGLVLGEYSYAWTMQSNPYLRITVRSSVDARNVAAATGCDSIRIIIEYSVDEGKTWKSAGKGPDAYTTRVKGWEDRLTAKIKEVFYGKVKKVQPNAIPQNAGYFFGFSKKDGPNKGRPFVSNPECNDFRWVGTA